MKTSTTSTTDITPDATSTTISTKTPQGKRRYGGLFGPFGARNFRLLFGGQLTSNVGDAFYAIALPWYMLTHGGPQALGLVLLAYGVPRTVFIAAGGSLADRLRPRRVMLVADAARTLLIAAIGVLISGFFISPLLWQLAALSAGFGIFSGLFLPASSSIIPDLLPDDELQAGNSLSSTSTQFASLVGPALGGLIVGFFAPWIALLADAGTFLVSALTLGAMRGARVSVATASMPGTPTADEAGAAAPSGTLDAEPAVSADEPRTFWKLLRRSSLLQVILMISIVGNIAFGGLIEVALPALFKGPFHATATEFGVAVGVFAIGALIGGLGAGVLGRLRARGVFMCLLWLAQAVVIALVPYAGGVLGAGILFGAMGFANASSNVFATTAIQQRMPRALLGRVMGATMLTSFGLYPLSVAAAGYLVQDFGPAILFPACGVLMAMAALMAVSRREIRQL